MNELLNYIDALVFEKKFASSPNLPTIDELIYQLESKCQIAREEWEDLLND